MGATPLPGTSLPAGQGGDVGGVHLRGTSNGQDRRSMLGVRLPALLRESTGQAVRVPPGWPQFEPQVHSPGGLQLQGPSAFALAQHPEQESEALFNERQVRPSGGSPGAPGDNEQLSAMDVVPGYGGRHGSSAGPVRLHRTSRLGARARRPPQRWSPSPTDVCDDTDEASGEDDEEDVQDVDPPSTGDGHHGLGNGGGSILTQDSGMDSEDQDDDESWDGAGGADTGSSVGDDQLIRDYAEHWGHSDPESLVTARQCAFCGKRCDLVGGDHACELWESP